MSFAQELRVDEFRARELFVDRDSHEETRALAREVLMMESADYAAAFKGSAIKRAKLWMLKRNACVVLGNIGDDEDLAVLWRWSGMKTPSCASMRHGRSGDFAHAQDTKASRSAASTETEALTVAGSPTSCSARPAIVEPTACGPAANKSFR